MNFPMSFQQQFSILLAETHTTNMRALARQIGVGQQTLLSLLNGMSASPRLDLAKKLCQHFGISLDYFDLDDEESCRQFIAQMRGASNLDTIHSETDGLPPPAQNAMLVLTEWLRRIRIRAE